MTIDIAATRLRNQFISQPLSETPANVVARLAAVQSQDFGGAKWGVGLRINGATDSDVESAFSRGEILRTHALRPTWHFVAAADIRWILSLTGPRVQAANAVVYRKCELDAATLRKTDAILAKSLRAGEQLTRDELRDKLSENRIVPGEGLRMAYIVMHAELEQIVCSGARRGKQFTYALLDNRAPKARTLTRDAALVELAQRYFTTRGPASAHDFAKWSGLTVRDGNAGLEAMKPALQSVAVNGKALWSTAAAAEKTVTRKKSAAYLLSIYDEYISSYKDRSALVSHPFGKKLIALGMSLTNVIVVDGQLVGTWKRTIKRKTMSVELNPFRKFTPAELRAVEGRIRDFRRFLGSSSDE